MGHVPNSIKERRSSYPSDAVPCGICTIYERTVCMVASMSELRSFSAFESPSHMCLPFVITQVSQGHWSHPGTSNIHHRDIFMTRRELKVFLRAVVELSTLSSCGWAFLLASRATYRLATLTYSHFRPLTPLLSLDNVAARRSPLRRCSRRGGPPFQGIFWSEVLEGTLEGYGR